MLKKTREIFPNTISATRELELTVGTKLEESQAQMKVVSTPQSSPSSSPSPASAAPPNTIKPQIQERGETIVFSLPRDLAVFNSENFRNSVLDSLKDGHAQAIFDLSQLDFLDSSGIGSLAAIYNSAREKGIAMRLCAPSDQILDVLKITRFHKLVAIYSTEQDALQGQNALTEG
jgi:anti-sigma B factor antagonist